MGNGRSWEHLGIEPVGSGLGGRRAHAYGAGLADPPAVIHQKPGSHSGAGARRARRVRFQTFAKTLVVGLVRVAAHHFLQEALHITEIQNLLSNSKVRNVIHSGRITFRVLANYIPRLGELQSADMANYNPRSQARTTP